MSCHYEIHHGRRIKVEKLDTPPKRKKREPFALIPLAKAADVCRALNVPGIMVVIVLFYLAWKAKGKSFSFSNELLLRYGVSRFTKYRVLTKLGAAGVIRQRQRGKKTPEITVL
jgi:hypothetical protein